MPTYQYACTECDHHFEQFQSFSDDSLTHCPVCDGRLRKVFNAVGVVFKGSGFYRTDSREGSKSKSSGSGETSGGTSGEPAASKPAAKDTPAASSASTSSGSSSGGSTGSTKPAST